MAHCQVQISTALKPTSTSIIKKKIMEPFFNTKTILFSIVKHLKILTFKTAALEWHMNL